MNRKIVASVAPCLLVLTHAAISHAQDNQWLADRRYREGIGYRAGDVEIHPGVTGEVGYDSNMYQRGPLDGYSADPTRNLQSAYPIYSVMRFRIEPSISISTLGSRRQGIELDGNKKSEPPTVNFRADALLSYNEYLALDSQYRADAAKFRNLGGQVDFNLGILPERPLGFQVYGSLIRTVQPSNYSDLSAAYNRLNGTAGADLVWAPGGGLFEWRLGYRFDNTYFEESDFSSLSNITNTITTRGRWRFLPRTSLVFDASQGFVRYPNMGSQSFLTNANPLRSKLGIAGLITESIGFLGMFGWGTSFLQPGGVPAVNYDGPLAVAQLTFFPGGGATIPGDTPRSTSMVFSQISLGYGRDFSTSYFGGIYSQDRGYVKASLFFGGRVLVGAEVGVAAVHFPTLYFSDASLRSNPFNETRLDVSGYVEYRFIDALGINLTVNYNSNSSVLLPTDSTLTLANNVMDDLSFKRLQAFLGLRWVM